MNKSKLGTSLWLLLPSKAYEIYFLPFTTILQKLEPSFHLYSYCKDLFYLYCKIPDNFWQGRNIVGSISYKNPVIHSMRINFISIYLEWQVLTSSVCTLQCMMGIDTIFGQNMKMAMKWKYSVYTLQYMMGIDAIFRQNMKMAMKWNPDWR